ncbi:MAG TPA: site-2 protease family protein [Nitrososphaeraceae archaeon]|nr:site-2 protease family protein [Nitrososphaeraceae archaeon]
MQTDMGIKTELKLPLILIHTAFGLKFFDIIAKTKIGKIYADFNTYLMPLITALAIFLILSSIVVLFSNDSARAGARDLGPQSNILIPGLNPILPWTYGWAALIVTIVIHEAGHGIVARVYNTKVESTGIVLFLGIPVGAFVNIQQDELNKTTFKQKSAILTAGPLNNMIMAGISLVLLFFVVSTLTPVPNTQPTDIGLKILGVNDKSIAQSIGLEKDSVLRSINGEPMNDVSKFREILKDNLGSYIEIKWTSSDNQNRSSSVKLPDVPPANNIILGVSLTNLNPDPVLVLDIYKNAFTSSPLAILMPPTIQQGIVPFSDLMAPYYTSSLFGDFFPIISNFLFWNWFINFNVGIFNALPIAMLDGGQWYGSLLEKKIKTKNTRLSPSTILTLIMLSIVIMAFVLPWIPW